MLLLLARSRPRPLTLMRPLVSMSALRSAIRHGPAPGRTPLTTLSLTFGNVPSGFAGPAPFATGMTPMPPSNLASPSRSCAPADPLIPSAIRITAAFFNITCLLLYAECHGGAAGIADAATPDLICGHRRIFPEELRGQCRSRDARPSPSSPTEPGNA